MNFPPSRPSRPVRPAHADLRSHRRRAVLAASVGVFLTALGLARAVVATTAARPFSSTVWWGVGLLLLLGPTASFLAVVLASRGLHADIDLRLRDFERDWRNRPDPERWPDAPGPFDVVHTPITQARVIVTGRRRQWLAPGDRPPAPLAPEELHRVNIDVMIVMDVSSSMTRVDPVGDRFVVARRLVDLVTAEATLLGPPGDDRIGVVLFADRAIPQVPLTPVATDNQRRLVANALQPCGGRGTSITGGLVEAAAQYTRQAEAVPVVLLFTDGRSDEPVEHLVVAARLIPRGCLHVLHPGELPARWAHVPVASRLCIEPGRTSAAAIEWHLVRILLAAFRLGRRDDA